MHFCDILNRRRKKCKIPIRTYPGNLGLNLESREKVQDDNENETRKHCLNHQKQNKTKKKERKNNITNTNNKIVPKQVPMKTTKDRRREKGERKAQSRLQPMSIPSAQVLLPLDLLSIFEF